MKKFNYVIVTILLACVMFFGGCATKAESANYKTCNDYFANVAKKYVSGNDYIFVPALIESTDSNTYVVDLFSKDAYNQTIYEQIESDSFDEESDTMNFGLLKKGNEYQTIMEAVSTYYARYQSQANDISVQNAINNGISIPQSVYADLYNQIDKLDGVSKALANKKTKFVTDCKNSISQKNNIQKSDFVNYLQAYQDFIQVVADINKAYQVLHFDYIYNYDTTSGQPLSDGQTQRWVDSAILYCGIYYYIKDMKNSLSLQNAFAHGISQDAGFTNKFCPILENRQDNLIANEDNGSAISTYQVAAKKLKSIINDLDNFDIASQKVMEYLKNNKLTSIDKTRSDYIQIKSYYEFTQIYDQNILDLQDLIVYYMQ